VPPYSAHGWANLSDSHVAVALELRSEPDDGNNYIEPSDERVAWGDALGTFDVQKDLAEATAAREPFRLRWLSLMGGKVAALSVVSEAGLDAAPAPTVAWVTTGEGKITAGGVEHAIHGPCLVFIPENTAVRVRATGDARLALILYRPARDDVTDILKKGTVVYSQGNEELIIRDFFQDRRSGVFLDVGAGAYARKSTTFYLEERLEWSGVAVDALGEYEAGYLEHRKRTRFANYLITDRDRGTQSFYRAGKALELSSISKTVAQDQARDEGDETVTELKVPTITLNELLKKQGVAKIDFLSMDIEEHEPAALAGFDVDDYSPQLVCIEVHRVVRDPIFDYFRRHRYVRLDKYLPYDSTNWYFTRSARVSTP
jgi:FkbM family methyltransferase